MRRRVELGTSWDDECLGQFTGLVIGHTNDSGIHNGRVLQEQSLQFGGRIPHCEIAASFAVNLAAPAAIANVFCRIFTDARQDRRIVNISSGAAQTPLPGSALYCAAKSGLEMMTRTLATEQGDDGIRIIALRPGIIDTDMQTMMRSQSEDVLPTAAMFRAFHAQRQLVAPEVAAEKIVEKILLARVEQGATYKYSEL